MSNFFDQNAIIAVILLGIAGGLMFLVNSWRWRVAGLALMYLGVFWLVAISWPLGLAAIKMVVGWMAGAILGVSGVNLLPPTRRRWPTEWIFLALAFLLVIVAVSRLAPVITDWFPGCHPAQAWGGLLLIGTGLIHLGVASRGLRTILSILTILAGFEILYAVVETSTLVAGLLAVVTLGLALTGAYLLGNIYETENAG
ncbi:MAG: hypothetical protein JW757_02555 [Anaerolineales bacterium]|nr:hypothetical protein [Anaerolineales bacterium]